MATLQERPTHRREDSNAPTSVINRDNNTDTDGDEKSSMEGGKLGSEKHQTTNVMVTTDEGDDLDPANVLANGK